MNNWTTQDELVGQRVIMHLHDYDQAIGTVTAVHKELNLIKVREESTGQVFMGNTYEEL